MKNELSTALRALVVFTVLTGVVYPAVVLVAARVFFRAAWNGSLIRQGGQVIGSRLIGQPFTAPGYFWGRPSATAPGAYNAAASSGSNYGPLDRRLRSRVEAVLHRLRAADPKNTEPVPVDLATASASGLDPQISPEAARWQIGRVATARDLAREPLERLVAEHTQGRTWGVLGEPVVNVLELNLALDRLAGGKLVSER